MNKDNIIQQIRSSSREMVRQFGLLNNCFSSIGSTSQCHALVELDASGVMNLNQLSEVLNLEKSTTSRLITQLLAKGACQIQSDENDRRNKLISLTKKGTQLVNKIHFEANLQVEKALDLLNEDEKNTVMQGLAIYAKALKRSHIQQGYTIRKLMNYDVPQLIHLIKSVWAEFGFDSSHPYAFQFENELKNTYATYNVKGSNYIVLAQDKKIVGGVGFVPLAKKHEKICELKGLYLSSQLRGLGLGASLLSKILNEASKVGYKQCYLETMDSMHGANALYKKFGFKRLGKPMEHSKNTWTNSWYIKGI